MTDKECLQQLCLNLKSSEYDSSNAIVIKDDYDIEFYFNLDDSLRFIMVQGQ